MVEHRFQIFLILLAVLAGAALLARRLNMAPAVMLLLTGIGLAWVPGLPRLEIAPEVVLLIVLPPLIYQASVAMSWREFKWNLRPIALLAIGCVIFTAAMVATATHYVMGLPWNVGFLLGAVVAPPDVVAPLAIARKLRLPRRVLVVLEGEGLANDATALILYRFAVVAITTGTFSLPKAATTFSIIVAAEIAFGIAVGWVSLRLRNRARDPQIEIILSAITPYVAFWLPHHVGGSGVLATVACGLYVSWNGPLLISAATRLQGVFFWGLVIYLIEGLLFLVTGAQMRMLIEKSKEFPVGSLLGAIMLVFAVVVIARFAWLYPATYLPRILSKRLAQRDPSPSWRTVFVIAFTGVRGTVSLAAALALPFTLPSGEAFPYRDLILFVAFGVILFTLVGLGLTLPFVVRMMGLSNVGLDEHRQEYEAELAARRSVLAATRDSIAELTKTRALSDEIVGILTARHRARHGHIPSAEADGTSHMTAEGAVLIRELIAEERRIIHRLLQEGAITDEARRRIERDLDLEEAVLSNLGYG